MTIVRKIKTAETATRIVGLTSLEDPGPIEKGIYYFEVDRNMRIDDALLEDYIQDTSTLIIDPAVYNNHAVDQIYIDTFNEVVSVAVIVNNPVTATQQDVYLGYIKNRRLERCTASFPFTFADRVQDFETRFFNDGIALRIFRVNGIAYPVTIGSH
jgi:hypothetical protein